MGDLPLAGRIGRKVFGERYGAARLIARRAGEAVRGTSERKQFERRFADREGTHVRRGPFKGMQFFRRIAGSTPVVPMLLGCYEEELHAAIEESIALEPGLVVDIGSAEGYYAVGLARRLPQSQVVAFDIDPMARHMCRRLARLNGVDSRVDVREECDIAFLATLPPEAFVVCDVDGAEKALLDPKRAPALQRVRILVEVHEVADPALLETLKTRFAPSHAIEQLSSAQRDPSKYGELRSYSHTDADLAVAEMRGDGWTWLVLRPHLT